MEKFKILQDIKHPIVSIPKGAELTYIEMVTLVFNGQKMWLDPIYNKWFKRITVKEKNDTKGITR